MSMNGFFKEFPIDLCNSMLKDNTLIERYIVGGPRRSVGLVDSQTIISALAWDEPKSVASTDVATAWDVLQNVLGQAGFSYDVKVDNVLSNGCVFISPRKVIEHSQNLSSWTHEKFIDALKTLDDDEIYHLDVFNDDDIGQEDLLDHFEKLVRFYAEAAKRKNGAVFYLA